jgi:hypothetical protein
VESFGFFSCYCLSVCHFSTLSCGALVCEGLASVGVVADAAADLVEFGVLAAGCVSKVLSLLSTCTYLQYLQVITAISELLVTFV